MITLEDMMIKVHFEEYERPDKTWTIFKPRTEISFLYDLARQLQGKGVHLEAAVHGSRTPFGFRVWFGELPE